MIGTAESLGVECVKNVSIQLSAWRKKCVQKKMNGKYAYANSIDWAMTVKRRNAERLMKGAPILEHGIQVF